MRPVRVAVPAGPGQSVVVPIDVYANDVTLALVNVSGVVSVDLEYTFDDVWDPSFNPATATWFKLPDGTALTADGAHALAESQVAGNETGAPIKATAVRANNTAGAGTATLQVVQGGLQS